MRRQFSVVAKQKLTLRPGLTSLYAQSDFESETFAEKKISKQDTNILLRLFFPFYPDTIRALVKNGAISETTYLYSSVY
jgi:hypothetical protein